MRHVLICLKCNTYTMKGTHCGKKTVTPRPAKWSPDDKYGKYRLNARKKELKAKGML